MEENEKFNAYAQFNTDYADLITALLKLKKESAILNISVYEVTLPEYWYSRYPELREDLKKTGLKDKLIGFKINL